MRTHDATPGERADATRSRSIGGPQEGRGDPIRREWLEKLIACCEGVGGADDPDPSGSRRPANSSPTRGPPKCGALLFPSPEAAYQPPTGTVALGSRKAAVALGAQHNVRAAAVFAALEEDAVALRYAAGSEQRKALTTAPPKPQAVWKNSPEHVEHDQAEKAAIRQRLRQEGWSV